jgi:hypothetical protein
MLPCRYNNKVACFTKVYIITNWALSEQYKNIQAAHPKTWQAFLRRIKVVYDFDKSKDIPVNKITGELVTEKVAQTEQAIQTEQLALIPLSDEEAEGLGF